MKNRINVVRKPSPRTKMKPMKSVLWATIPKVGNRALTTRDLYDDRKKAKYDVDGTTLGNLLYRIARVEIREIAPKSRKR